MRFFLSLIFIFFLGLIPLSADAKSVKETFEEAVSAYMQNDYDKSISLFEQILDGVPNFAPAYNYLGMVHKAKGTRASEVIWLFKTAIEIDPNYALAYENLSKAYYAVNDFDNAEKYALKAVEINPDMMNSQLALGWIYLLGKSDPKKAIPYFRIVTEKQKAPFAFYGLGLAYFMDDRGIESLEAITSLRQLGKEELALQLESLIRSKSYKPTTTPGVPLPIEPRESGQIVSDVPATKEEKAQKLNDLKVYLRGRMPGSDESAPAVDANSSPSDVERIQALQRKRGNY